MTFSYGREFLLNLRNVGNSDTDFSNIAFPTTMLVNLAQSYNDSRECSTEFEEDGETRMQQNTSNHCCTFQSTIITLKDMNYRPL